MTKAIILSIQSQHAVNILNGKKTLELRTFIPKNYKGWVYVYVTKGKPYLVKFYNDYPIQAINDYTYQELLDDGNVPMNGKVAFRFWFDEYDTYNYEDVSYPEGYEDYDGTFVDTTNYVNGYYVLNTELEKLCLSYDEFETYGNGKTLYAWHIKQLEVFDTPKRLSEFYVTNKGLTYKYIKEYEEYTNDTISFRLKKAPQSWQYVYVKGERK